MTPLVGFALAACLLPVISAIWLATRAVVPSLVRQPGLGHLSGDTLDALPRGAIWLATLTGLGTVFGHPVAVVVLLALATAIIHFLKRSSPEPLEDQSPDAAAVRDVGREDADLHQSWLEAIQLGADNDTVTRARSSCTALLRAHKSDPLDLGVLEWVVFLRSQIPALIRACTNDLLVCRDKQQKETLIIQLSETLEAARQETELRLREAHKASQRHFELQRNYILARARVGRPSPKD